MIPISSTFGVFTDGHLIKSILEEPFTDKFTSAQCFFLSLHRLDGLTDPNEKKRICKCLIFLDVCKQVGLRCRVVATVPGHASWRLGPSVSVCCRATMVLRQHFLCVVSRSLWRMTIEQRVHRLSSFRSVIGRTTRVTDE